LKRGNREQLDLPIRQEILAGRGMKGRRAPGGHQPASTSAETTPERRSKICRRKSRFREKKERNRGGGADQDRKKNARIATLMRRKRIGEEPP